MATLEDKILGEKKEYYCSSSEDEDPDDYEDDNRPANLNSCRKESYSVNVSILFTYIILFCCTLYYLDNDDYT